MCTEKKNPPKTVLLRIELNNVTIAYIDLTGGYHLVGTQEGLARSLTHLARHYNPDWPGAEMEDGELSAVSLNVYIPVAESTGVDVKIGGVKPLIVQLGDQLTPCLDNPDHKGEL